MRSGYIRKYNSVKEDFDIDLMDCTHVNIVMKRKG